MNITEILHYETRKILEILQLFWHTSGTISLRTLACELSVDKKTANKYIKKVQFLIDEHQLSDQLVVTVFKGHTVRFEIEDLWYLEHFRQKLLCATPEIYFFDRLLMNKSVSKKKMATVFFESEAKVGQRISRIRQWLTPFELTLRHSTLELSGSELQIREFMYHYFFNVHQEIHQMIQPALLKKIQHMCNILVDHFHLAINQLQKQQLLLGVYVQFARIEQGNVISLDVYLREFCSASNSFAAFLEELNEQEFEGLPIEEKMYLFLYLHSKFSFAFSKELRAVFIYENYAEKTYAYSHAQKGAQIIRGAFPEYEITFDKKAYVSLLSFHLYYRMFHGFLYEDIFFLQQLFNDYPASVQRLKHGIEKYAQEISGKKRINNEVVLFRYFYIASEVLRPITLEKRKNIYVVLDWEPLRTLHFISRIKTFFKDKKNIRLIEGGLHTEYMNADVVITTTFFCPTV